MIVEKNIRWKLIIFYTWKNVLYYTQLAIVVYFLYHTLGYTYLSIPSYTITAFGTALAIFLGFKNNSAYDRWWEARRLWGSLVNYSRVWTRQVMNFIIEEHPDRAEDALALRQRMLYRHIAYVHALRVALRKKSAHNVGASELYEVENEYSEVRPYVSEPEYRIFRQRKNPPDFLLERQTADLRTAFSEGWLSDYRLVNLESTLTEFVNIQGGCERIKNTPLPRHYTFFSRVFVFIHATLLPFAFVKDLGLGIIPVSVVISFIFHLLDLTGERTEEPFENRLEDVPLSAICASIETNAKEQWGDANLPKPQKEEHGILF